MSKELELENQLDMMFLVSGEMVPGHGEDSYFCAYRDNAACVGVFDGCGGLGSCTYPSIQGHTGAYMASRLASGALNDWFHTFHGREWNDSDEILGTLRSYLSAAFRVCKPYIERKSGIKGSMVRELPTTAAIAYARPEKNGMVVHVIWAGDSRVYILDGKGLAQLTDDDLEGQDALSNLSNDAALTNVISSDGNYTLHYRYLRLEGPAIIFSATDGCFGYISSPMEFEYVLLQQLENAGNAEEFQNGLEAAFREVTGDDFAFACMAFHYDTFRNLKEAFARRTDFLESRYIAHLESEKSDEILLEMWQEYRKDYERFL